MEWDKCDTFCAVVLFCLFFTLMISSCFMVKNNQPQEIKQSQIELLKEQNKLLNENIKLLKIQIKIMEEKVNESKNKLCE